jgi:AhpD family alkylhydroperoxidase
MGKLGKQTPALGAYGQLHRAALADGALTTKIKELMCLAISIAIGCEGCIAYHVAGSLKAGASRKEIAETIGVAIMMAGGPGSVNGALALQALDEFEEARSQSGG